MGTNGYLRVEIDDFSHPRLAVCTKVRLGQGSRQSGQSVIHPNDPESGPPAHHPFRPFARDERRLAKALMTKWLDQRR